MRKVIYLLFFLSFYLFVSAQPLKPAGIYPTHWWTGMKNPKLQLMIHAPSAGAYSYSIKDQNVELVKTSVVQNRNYAFLDLLIKPGAKPGIVRVNWKKGNNNGYFDYTLKPHRKGNGTEYAQGVRQEDFIYLIMPDRFSNGDYRNDRIARYKDQSLNRKEMYDRHGGDIEGVIQHLDYLKDLGVTTVWLTPILDNDMPKRTEHGYAITDHYQVDERHGGNLAYKRLGDSLHKRGMKLIQDAVYNHTGIEHFLYRDMPDSSWFHQWPTYTESSYKDQPLFDPYGAASDKKKTSEGWFGNYPHMPDVNQNNPFFANYLIQNAIWSVEEFGVDGWRIDTYIYNDLNFMNRCNKALTDEYPKITMFGETWVHGVLNQAYFTRNNFNIPFKSNLTGATDFQTNMYGINPALTQSFGWTEGVNKLYQTLASDFVYQDPTNNVNFLDNHDMTRFISQVNEDVDKLKMGIGWLLTTRGIPQMYYGTEILMKGIKDPDGKVRADFLGGWKEDSVNKFMASGRTVSENEVFNWTRTIAQYRNHSYVLKNGKLMQYVPEDWVYTYFRYNDQQSVMVVMNTATEERTIDPQRFAERVNHYSKARNIVNGDSKELDKKWTIPGKTIWILELAK